MKDAKTIIHCCVEKDVYDMLMRHCEETGQTKTMAIKRAIRAYCQSQIKDAVKPCDEGKHDNA